MTKDWSRVVEGPNRCQKKAPLPVVWWPLVAAGSHCLLFSGLGNKGFGHGRRDARALGRRASPRWGLEAAAPELDEGMLGERLGLCKWASRLVHLVGCCIEGLQAGPSRRHARRLRSPVRSMESKKDVNGIKRFDLEISFTRVK